MARNSGAAQATINGATVKTGRSNGDSNKIRPEDRPAHEWYRFVLSYPPHLVRDYLEQFGVGSGQVVLDPFSGTGTTPVECKKQGVESVGVEANPMSFFASSVKLDWSPDPDGLIEHARHVADRALNQLRLDGVEDCPAPFEANGRLRLRSLDDVRMKLILTNSISPLPLHKALALLDAIEADRDDRYYRHERLAFAKSVVANSSNLHFGPEVGVSPPKPDAPVVTPWIQTVEAMAADLRVLRPLTETPARVFHADARDLGRYVDGRVDAVITSPPYPNEKDYTRTTRLEAILLGFARTMQDIRDYKRNSVRSNTRGVYKDDTDDQWIAGHPEVERIAREIEERRIELGKTSGFEKLYARVTKLYFGGMKRHLAELRSVLNPGAQLAYVVGDQASYLRVMIRTGQLLADIAQELGYEVTSIDLFRTRLATATKEQLREEVVVLRWPGRYPSMAPKKTTPKSYDQIIERIFFRHYREGDIEVAWERDEIGTASEELGIAAPKNFGDVPYSFRYRAALPEAIKVKAPEGTTWVIRSVGRSKYKFVATTVQEIVPDPSLPVTKIPDSTPGLVARYSKGDEQALLVRLRYNRLIDTFTGTTCYSLQNHLRTTVEGIGQVETDEVYVGVDGRGAHYVFPVQAKGGKDRQNIVQIEQDFAVCAEKFPKLIPRAIAAQFMANGVIALFAFEEREGSITKVAEAHYKLVSNADITDEEVASHRELPPAG